MRPLTDLVLVKHGPCMTPPPARTALMVLRDSHLFTDELMEAFQARETFGREKYGAFPREGWEHSEIAAFQEVMDLAVYCACSERLTHLLPSIASMLTSITNALESQPTRPGPSLGPCRNT